MKQQMICTLLIFLLSVLILTEATANYPTETEKYNATGKFTTEQYTICKGCHPSYFDAIEAKQHAGTDYCLICHRAPYDTSSHNGQYIGYAVNAATCNQAICHSTTSGYAQRPVEANTHNTSSPPGADCTWCHFANTTRVFPQNNSLYVHDHNFTVEYNFYNYNLSGMPTILNSGTGFGMFPYYTCALTCHKSGSTDKITIGWNQSKHAQSFTGTETNSCARCKSPPNYNVSAGSAPIAAADWQGIQCRVCHNMHNVSYSGANKPAFPLAFYNATLTSIAAGNKIAASGASVYEKISISTELCEKCHTGTTHDSKFAGTHKDVVGFGCADCHSNRTFTSDLTQLHIFEVKNTTSGVTGCEVCHKTEDHTFQFTSKHTGKVTCEACHDKTVARNATGYAVSSDGTNYGLYLDPATGLVSSWKNSHGTPATWPLHNISKPVSCDKCHGTKSKPSGLLLAPVLGQAEPGNYTGNSSNCKTCHPAQYAKWSNSSHTSKLVTRYDAIERGYPAPPNGDGNWSNISYTIGGHWKIRYVDNYGYILTNGTKDGRTPGGPGKTQFNVDTQTWSNYNRNVTKAYICGNCHTTGYLQTNMNDSLKEPWRTLRELGIYPDGVYDNSLAPGFTGWWAENNIGCESCHGYGGDHIASPSKDTIPRNASNLRSNPAVCGNCHSRPDTGEYENLKQYPDGVNDTLLNDTLYDSSPMPTVNYSKVGGHHEQWEDWKASVHANVNVNCVTCHGGHSVSDPAYAGGPTGKVKFTNGSVFPAAVNKTCTDCHALELPKHGYYTSNSECVSCHMPKNRKSSDIIDLRSHWFNTSALKSNKNGEIHGYNFQNLSNISNSCSYCHGTQSNEISGTRHNKTLNIASAQLCNDCHKTGYTTEIVNETYTCRNCHIEGVNLNESHGNKYYGSNKADCTQCHFANTTQKFDKNSTQYRNAHILTVEYNFYNYNLSGMPLSSNGGVGKGMFPYYTCTLTCHGTYKVEEEVTSWNESAHARSRHGNETYDSKNSCAKCKSPPNYNVSASSSAPIAEADWQGIQCRVCHNLHNDTYSGNQSPAFPLAFYNATATSNRTTNPTGSPVYEKVANATVLCENCHTGTTHDSKFAGTHKDAAGFDCASCHVNKTFNNESHLFEVKNTTSGVTGCKVCHDAAHSSFFEYQYHNSKVECWACHDQTTTNRNATNYSVSPDRNYGLYKDSATNTVTTYKVSHGAPATWPLHNITKGVTCTKCHGARSLYTGGIAAGFGGDYTYTSLTTDPLVSGYNLIALSIIPDPTIHAKDLLYPTKGGIPGVTKVMRWNSGAQQWEGYEYIVASGIYIGNNFTMDGNKGYFIKGNASTAGQTYTFQGRR